MNTKLALTFLSLFCGFGGLSAGMALAELRFRAAIDPGDPLRRRPHSYRPSNHTAASVAFAGMFSRTFSNLCHER